jgi:chemotaxis protein CheD
MIYNKIIVRIADLNCGRDPCVLTTLGLGSCVGVAFYDAVKKVAGLLHAMLPDSTKASDKTNRAKFVDTGIEELLEKMIALGAKKENLRAKVAGGAQMFAIKAGNDILKIGEKNVEKTLSELRRLGIPLTAKDVGGNYGRTIELESDTGMLLVKTIGHGESII